MSLWMRRHPMFGDSVITGILVLLALAELSIRQARVEWWLWWPADVLLLVPLVFRRRRPVLVAYLVLIGGAVQLVTIGLPIRASDLALCVALYSLLVYTQRRIALGYTGFLLTGLAITLAWRAHDWQTARNLVFSTVISFGFVWVLGEFIGARKAYQREVERRLALLETERDQQAKIAVAAERTRIARELHDVVAHAVSVIVVQADGAGYTLRTNPDLAERALATISETGREALIELRRLLDVLRSDGDDDGPGERTPQPSVASLAELTEKVSAVGLPVTLTQRGDLSDLPAAIGLGVYRIVQEALTNTLKHAGPGARATVRVERVGGLVEVEVRDDGLGIPRTLPARELVTVSGGNGLIGMRERASVLGGSLVAGASVHGGWRVRATFPIGGPKGGERH